MLTMLATILHLLPYLIGTLLVLLVLFVMYGFWRGLTLRPHKDGHRAPPLSKYYWWAND